MENVVSVGVEEVDGGVIGAAVGRGGGVEKG